MALIPKEHIRKKLFKAPRDIAVAVGVLVIGIMAVKQGHEALNAALDYKRQKQYLSELTRKQHDLKVKKLDAGSLNVALFDTAFYQGNINAYAKVKAVENMRILSEKGDYANTMRLRMEFQKIEPQKLATMIKDFNHLGFITQANETLLVMEVAPFSREDALAQLSEKKDEKKITVSGDKK